MSTLEDFRTGLVEFGGLRRFTRQMLIRCLQDGPQNARPPSMHSLNKNALTRAVASSLKSLNWQHMAVVARDIQREAELDQVSKGTR